MTVTASSRIQWAYFCLSHWIEIQIQFFLLITGQPLYQAERVLLSTSHREETSYVLMGLQLNNN
jgi:hypothetical protein